jgi:hypothetical protein
VPAAGAGLNDGPVIVLGCARSGTTLLQVMLHSHHRLAIAPETKFLLRAYRRRLRFGDLRDPGNRRALGEFIVRAKFFDRLGLDPEEAIREVVAAPPTFGSAVGAVLRAYAKRFDRPRWGEKRPGYNRHIDMVMRLFPDAHLVHVVRDPRDVVASLKRMPWWRHGAPGSVSAWAQSVDYVEDAARRWPVTRVLYERLVADPERELRALCAALGEEYDPAMAEPERLAPEVVPERRWHRRARGGPSTDPVGRWRERLEPWEAALCETVLARRMEKLGYELTGAGQAPAGQVGRYAYVQTSRKLHRRLELARDRWKRRSEPNPVAAELTSGQRRAVGVPSETFQ